MWNVVRKFINSLPRPFREARSEYNQIATGTETAAARWRTCAAMTNKNFEYATALLYTNAHLSEDARERVRMNCSIGMVD